LRVEGQAALEKRLRPPEHPPAAECLARLVEQLPVVRRKTFGFDHAHQLFRRIAIDRRGVVQRVGTQPDGGTGLLKFPVMFRICGLKNRFDMRGRDNLADLAVSGCQNPDKPPVTVNDRTAAVAGQGPCIGMDARPRTGICRRIDRKVTGSVDPRAITPLIERNDMQLLGFAIRHCWRVVRQAIGGFHPQDDKVSREIMCQRRGRTNPTLDITCHDLCVIFGNMPIGDDKTVGNHRSGRDHVWRLYTDDPVGPNAYRLRRVACQSGHRNVKEA